MSDYTLNNDDTNLQSHKMIRHLIEEVIIPEHEKRVESKEFTDAKETLRKDDHYKCWICGSEENLEVHHFFCEWSLANDCDFNELKKLCELFDIYGYANKMKDEQITSVDDVRNMMVLCQKHHIHKDYGIHEITFPIWLFQKIVKNGIEIIPPESDI